MLALDLEKVFDVVCHEGLINKLIKSKILYNTVRMVIKLLKQ